jgi:cytochrome d ubiquinol oxidase subunit I
MQTPQGFTIENGHLIPQDWLAIIFNPSFPYRLFHMAIAAFLSSAMFVGASAAWHLLRGNDSPAIRKMLSMAMWMALLVAPIQAVVGDMHGLNTLEHQPAKIAAIEGHWENRPARPRRCCCLACRIWSRSAPAMVWRSRSRQPDPHPQPA